MKKGLAILVIVNFIFGCSTSRKVTSGNLFDLIRNKKETPEMLPTNLDFSRRFTAKEINALKLDTTQLDANDYYFLSDEPFLSKKIEGIDFQIYFTHKFGDELTKWLRITTPNSVHDRILSLSGGDSNSYELTTEFVRESLFIESETNKETVKDDISVMAYEIDSIVKTFSYDRQFKFLQTGEKKYRIYKEYGLQGKEWKEQKRTVTKIP